MSNCVRIFLKVYNAEKKNEDTIYSDITLMNTQRIDDGKFSRT